MSVGSGILPHMEDTWETRDLPVLRAAVELYEQNGGGGVAPSAIAARLCTDEETVQRSLDALVPYFEGGLRGDDQVVSTGRPTSEARRAVGAWPSPEAQLERLIAALEAAANDESRDEEERSRFKQAALWLGGAASQVAIGALSGAGGNMLTGG
jgi:hypothetical protein